jgi:hypothetical protein
LLNLALPFRCECLNARDFLHHRPNPTVCRSVAPVGAATVVGAPMRPEGEIYINANGKHVVRVNKSTLRLM